MEFRPCVCKRASTATTEPTDASIPTDATESTVVSVPQAPAARAASGYLVEPKGFATKLIHSTITPDRWDSMCIVPPIIMSSSFKQYGPDEFQQYLYGRIGNPTRDVLEQSLASLEDAKYAFCYGSGMATLSSLMSVNGHNYHIVSCDNMYGGNFCLLDEIGKNFGIELTAVDATNPDNVRNAMRPETKLIFIETPTNPLLKVIDIEAISAIAKENNVLLVVDNTFLTPFFQRPLDLGADAVTYSLTKYMNGHSDIIMGAIVTNNSELQGKLQLYRSIMGNIPSPFDCSLVIRGLKTLPLRMKKHNSNALEVGKFLESHPRIQKVIHPGLESHPQHELTKRQTSGHSGMISFYLEGGLNESSRFLKALKLFTLATSSGGFESIAETPSTISHQDMPAHVRNELKITDNLIRMSVGLEDPEDLIEDLQQALDNL